ncbi:DUF805 domain-containing protein [Lacticaseibacillus porcinae]|uniref:DUF805 domain-containing protein n=1 Tax=Lacticaseibacillus porcinae TaxID=1123687 RepID=UPI0013DE583E|nr:DUF805 domain-containing protein [Lacticaseibacillus porcinae]
MHLEITTPAIYKRTHNRYYGVREAAAVMALWANGFNFNGCSTRCEYWWVQLAGLGVQLTLSLFDLALGWFAWLWTLPMLSLTVRRYRDAGVWWPLAMVLRVWLSRLQCESMTMPVVIMTVVVIGVNWGICSLPSRLKA